MFYSYTGSEQPKIFPILILHSPNLNALVFLLLSLKILLQKESWVSKKRKKEKKKKKEKMYKSNPSSLKSFQFLKERYVFKEQE
jgi:hypothetical protein